MTKKTRTYALTLDETRNVLKKSKIDVLDGHIYSIYECGHIFDSIDDPQKTLYLRYNNSHNRVCPKCYNGASKLVVKYKKCGCGKEQLGYNVHKSECCKYCPRERIVKFRKQKAVNTDSIYNKKLADPLRWDCKYRDDCLTYYSKKHQAIPCKGCKKYIVGFGENDAL